MTEAAVSYDMGGIPQSVGVVRLCGSSGMPRGAWGTPCPGGRLGCGTARTARIACTGSHDTCTLPSGPNANREKTSYGT